MPANGPIHKDRKGQPKTIPDMDVVPTRELSAEELEVFNQAVRSRPNYWTEADRALLTSYAKAVVRYQDAENSDEFEGLQKLALNLRIMRDLANMLRLSPYTRETSAFADKPGKNEEDRLRENAQEGRGGANDLPQTTFAPWHRPDNSSRRAA